MTNVWVFAQEAAGAPTTGTFAVRDFVLDAAFWRGSMAAWKTHVLHRRTVE
mgnify:CR=1 FL=1